MFGGCSPHLMCEMQHRARGLRVTKCYPSVVRSILRPFASGRVPPTVGLVVNGNLILDVEYSAEEYLSSLWLA